MRVMMMMKAREIKKYNSKEIEEFFMNWFNFIILITRWGEGVKFDYYFYKQKNVDKQINVHFNAM